MQEDAESEGAAEADDAEDAEEEEDGANRLGATSFAALDCQGCLSHFEDAYYCSTADQVESDSKATNSAYDYGFCCGGGNASAKAGVAAWAQLQVDQEEAAKSPAEVPLEPIPDLWKLGIPEASNPFPRPLNCMTIPKTRYKCSNMYITRNVYEYVIPENGTERARQIANASSELYKNFLRYTTCLGHVKYKDGKAPVVRESEQDSSSESTATIQPRKPLKVSNCGPRELFAGPPEGTWTEIEVDAKSEVDHLHAPQDTQLCVWRLFSEQEDSSKVDGVTVRSRKMLDYQFYFYANQTENAEVFLFDYDSRGGGTVLEQAQKFSEMQAELEEDPIDISWHDFEHTDVYLLARKINVTKKAFKVKIKYQFEQNLGLPLWAAVLLCLFSPSAFIAMFCAGLYTLHRKGIIEVRIPKPCRCLCFKYYLSPEEKDEIRRQAELARQ